MIQTIEPKLERVTNGCGGERSQQRAEQSQAASTSFPSNKQRPRLGCAGLIRCGDSVLLGKRNKEPNRGLWVLPGGGVEFCESFTATLQRELLEEAGIQVDVQGVFKVYELINPPSEHRVIVYLNGNYRSGEPIASSDLSEVRFFQKRELQKMCDQQLISSFVEKVLREAAFL
jgi:8-oxo-dGTP diphosphatase